ncbi:MAG: hypothetical protein ACKOAY_07805 [Haliscomenobacter sp.]
MISGIWMLSASISIIASCRPNSTRRVSAKNCPKYLSGWLCRISMKSSSSL